MDVWGNRLTEPAYGVIGEDEAITSITEPGLIGTRVTCSERAIGPGARRAPEESMICYVFRSTPEGEVYEETIAFSSSIASKLLLVVRDPEKDPGRDIQEVLTALEPFLIIVERSNSWPGTVLLADTADLYWYRACAELGSLLIRLRSGLFDWVHPETPEDPCFCRADGSALLVTTSHEQEAYLLLTPGESSRLAVEYPDLAQALAQEGEIE